MHQDAIWPPGTSTWRCVPSSETNKTNQEYFEDDITTLQKIKKNFPPKGLCVHSSPSGTNYSWV